MMRSATAFLPDSITTFMNFERSTLPNFGSGRISRLGTSRRRGISFFLQLQSARGFDPRHGRPPPDGAVHLLGKRDALPLLCTPLPALGPAWLRGVTPSSAAW